MRLINRGEELINRFTGELLMEGGAEQIVTPISAENVRENRSNSEILGGDNLKKQEFLERVNTQKLSIGEYIIVLDSITNEPLVMGGAFDQGKWKVYKTKERGGHYIIKETDSEDEAFNLLYELVVSRNNRIKNS